MKKNNRIKLTFKDWVFEMLTNEEIAKKLVSAIYIGVWLFGLASIFHAIPLKECSINITIPTNQYLMISIGTILLAISFFYIGKTTIDLIYAYKDLKKSKQKIKKKNKNSIRARLK